MAGLVEVSALLQVVPFSFEPKRLQRRKTLRLLRLGSQIHFADMPMRLMLMVAQGVPGAKILNCSPPIPGT